MARKASSVFILIITADDMEIRRKKKTIDEFWYILIVRTTMNMCWRKEDIAKEKRVQIKNIIHFNDVLNHLLKNFTFHF
jgi:hypothetical protein